jgi:hypothetical protein
MTVYILDEEIVGVFLEAQQVVVSHEEGSRT